MTHSTAILHESRHLTEEQLMPPETTCGFCGAKNRSIVCILQQNPQVYLLKCDHCGAASASRIPTIKALDEYYGAYYNSSATADESMDQTQRITFDGAQRLGAHLAGKTVDHLNHAHVKILDFGGGDGTCALHTASQLVKRGFAKADVTVIDYNKTLVKTTDPRITLTRQDALDTHVSPEYDLVIASAVLEHLPQPKEILVTLLNFLNQGGVFYARTPYVVPLIKVFKLFGQKWDFTFPAHIHDLGQDFWETFFGEIVRADDFTLLESKPSIVETRFHNYFFRTLAAYSAKAPWYLFRKRYGLVGGWEVFARRNQVTTAIPKNS